MAIQLKDVLISINCTDWSFTNPVRLTSGFEMLQQIGHANLKLNNNDLYADITIIDDDFNYLDLYPTIAFNSNTKTIIIVSLAYMSNSDKRIKKIKDQLNKTPLTAFYDSGRFSDVEENS